MGKMLSSSLVQRIEFCYTPEHGSWLNIAEGEIGRGAIALELM
jgi:hypothetical protein